MQLFSYIYSNDNIIQDSNIFESMCLIKSLDFSRDNKIIITAQP